MAQAVSRGLGEASPQLLVARSLVDVFRRET